jgi:hypothetical protein
MPLLSPAQVAPQPNAPQEEQASARAISDLASCPVAITGDVALKVARQCERLQLPQLALAVGLGDPMHWEGTCFRDRR